MTTWTRRSLFKQTSLGAATAGALIALPSLGSASIAAAAQAAPVSMPREPLAAYIHNAATGEIAFLIGSREIVIRDADLVRRLVLAAN